MKKGNLNIYFIIANISFVISAGIGRFIGLPHAVNGFLSGISIVMFLFGAYSYNHDMSKLRNFKRKLFGRLIS
jgi:hypothetical protein